MDEASNENCRSPRDLTYIKWLRALLRTLNGWPCRETGMHEPKYSQFKTWNLFIQSLMFFTPSLLYLIKHSSEMSFFQLGHNYITLLIHVVYMTRIYIPLLKSYKLISEEFLMKLHLIYFKHKSDYAMKTHIKVHKLCHVVFLILMVIGIIGITFFNIVPVYNNYQSGMYSRNRPENSTYLHAIAYILPFDYDRSFKGYVVVFIFNWYISYYCTAGIMVFDVYLFLMVFHLRGHYNILIHELKSFHRPDHKVDEYNFYKKIDDNNTDMYTVEEQEVVFRKLYECIDYHRTLGKFVKLMSHVFGPMIAIYNLFHLVTCCVLLLECSQWHVEALMLYGPLTFTVFWQLIQLAVVFELLRTEIEKVKHSVYNIPWECMDKRNRQSVLYFLMHVQNQVTMKALGVLDVGVTTMASILKSSFSYFAFLRTVAE